MWRPWGLLFVLALTVSPVIYKTVEKIVFAKILVMLVFLTVALALVTSASVWGDAVVGTVAVGNLPVGDVPVALFLGALTSAGAGGIGNLVQSNWVRDKGMGYDRSALRHPTDIARVRDRYFTGDRRLLSLAMGARPPHNVTPDVRPRQPADRHRAAAHRRVGRHVLDRSGGRAELRPRHAGDGATPGRRDSARPVDRRAGDVERRHVRGDARAAGGGASTDHAGPGTGRRSGTSGPGTSSSWPPSRALTPAGSTTGSALSRRASGPTSSSSTARGPNLTPVPDPVSAIVCFAGVRDVDTVLVDGDIVKRDGRLMGDLARARELALASRARLDERAAEADGPDYDWAW